ncbi:MAG: hypothetical protein C5B53_01730 [Candidatus Melainabacteria bacterium]|nr:MAG: hypothetical protein C5B53_01730 [Candidatus Melainabacteria bacterium]
MLLVRNLLVFAILATCLSTVAFAYDLGDDSTGSKNQTPKETKRGGKGIFRHRKIASAPAKAEPNSATTPAETNEKVNAPQ